MNVYVWNVNVCGKLKECVKRETVESESMLNVKPSVESECV